MSFTHGDYTVAWICALPLELAAAKTMLDDVHPPLPQPESDHNVYTLGRVGSHNVVVACLPGGVYGTISATGVVSHMVSTFPTLRFGFGLMVGIGGGVPSPRNDIRLGDVVVSRPTTNSSGVIQFDYGKTLRGGRFQHTGSLNKPPPVLLKAVSQLESGCMTGKRPTSEILVDTLHKSEKIREEFSRPKVDWLFSPNYDHKDSEHTCSACDQTQLMSRSERETDDPYIHYGLIASGDQVMKDAKTRDSIARDLDILCFEMEAAGLMDELPSLVIRGICDYCDSHKNKQWQRYAALAAASYAKALLSVIPTFYRNESREPGKPVWMVPFQRNPRFAGREGEIIRIEELLLQQNGPSKIAICGLGGVGKTQIALELAYRMRNRDPTCSICWITCTSYESVEQAYMNIASKLKMTDIKPAEVKEKVKAYLSQESAGKWLVIFDNADDMGMWGTNDTTDTVLTDFLPESEQGHILFTTRSRKVAVKLASSHVVAVTEPNTEISIQILKNSLVEKTLLNDRITALSLLEQLACLPLAITQAAAYINENSIGLSDYLQLLRDQEPHVIELLSEEFGDEMRYKDIQNPVALTWFISFQQIQQSNKLAADYLLFFACINPRDIPQSLLPQPISNKDKTDALGLLKAFSFISEGNGNSSLNLHRLVHLATRNWMRKNQQFSRQILKSADRLSEVFPDDDHANRQMWREYLPHALSLIAEAGFWKEQEKYIDLIRNVCSCLSSDGRWKEAEELGVQVLELYKRVLGPEHPDTLSSMSNLALTYWNRGQWKEAEELQIQVMELDKRVLGPEHPDTLSSLANLASTYRDQGQWKEAEEMQVQVLELRKRVLGPEHPDTLSSMANLASTYRIQGRWKEAEELEVQVLELHKRVLGPEHPNTLTSMANLASTYRDQGRWKEAGELEIQVLELHKQVLGPEHPNTLTSMGNLASTYWNQGRWKKAEDLDMQVLVLRKQVLGPEHPDTLNSMANLASTYWNQGRWKEAEELQVQVLVLRKQVLGPEHPDTLNSMANLAFTYRIQGRWKEAEELGVQVLELRKRVLGPEHPDTLTSMSNLSFPCKGQGKVKNSLALIKQCAELRRNLLGPDHPDTISSSGTLSDWETAVDSPIWYSRESILAFSFFAFPCLYFFFKDLS
ncbi:kinesin light chain [Aspergillus awamori]|uniref:Kinesin light chain n=1 Tax=Aspergillus awamori TaxID=105351 RepID=A0A401L2N4_ASPAW|nr:kinesin light chain [Aspergillus awamori]